MVAQLFALFLFFSTSVYSQTSKVHLDEIVVSTKNDKTQSESLINTEVITSEEIEKLGETSVFSLLKKIGGIEVAQSGGSGGQASFYYRGLEMRHMLVLINGVKVSDPSNTDRHFDFSNLDLSDVEKIEIIKGAGSVLYGSEAIAGVLNIVTKKASQDKIDFRLRSGIQKSFWLKTSKVNEKDRFNIQTSLSEANYNSSASSGDEFDKYQNQNYSGFYERELSRNIIVNFFSKFQKSNKEFDGVDFSTGEPIDNLDNQSFDLDQIYSSELEASGDNSKLNLKLSHHRIDRETIGENPNLYTGSSNQYDIRYFKKLKTFDFLIGVDGEKEFIHSNDMTADASLVGIYTKISENKEKLFWDLGLRGSNHSLFSSILVGGAGVGYKIRKDEILKLNYATGFKSPSLYQLYAPPFGTTEIGNEDLRPERSQNLELNYEKKFEFVKESISLFYYDVNDLIDFGDDGYENLNSFKTYGIELNTLYSHKAIEVEWIISSQSFDSKTPLRRAHEKINLNLAYFINDHHEVEFQNRWSGYRFDEQNGTRFRLDAYTVTDFAYYYRLNNYKLGLLFKNLFNEDYEVIKGYSVDRFNYGLELQGSF